MKTAATATARTVCLVTAAPATLIVGLALPGVGVARWVSPQPHVQALPNQCELATRRYRDDLNFQIPPQCVNSDWFRGSNGHWDRPLPGDWHSQRQPPGAPDALPPPPGDAPLPPPGQSL
jgi:hypothetical protein